MMKLSTRNRICCYITAFVLLTTIALTQQSCGNDVQGKLDELATEMNSSLPMTLDSTIRLDKVEAKPERTLEYHYTVLVQSDNEALKQRLTKEFTENAGSPNMEAFRQDNVQLVYRYKDEAGKDLFDIKIEPADHK